jgi:DNA-binding transcriptional LysR family regulator
MTVRLRANNGSVLAQGAASGLGVTLQPRFIVRDAIAAGELVPLLVDHVWPEYALYAVYPQTRHLSAKARAFVDYLREQIARDEGF